MVSNTFMLHVPYRGTGPMLTDLMAGRLQAASVGAPAPSPIHIFELTRPERLSYVVLCLKKKTMLKSLLRFFHWRRISIQAKQ